MIVINNYKSYDMHVDKLSYVKQFLLTAAFVLDIPFKHTFCNDHIILTFCIDSALILALPTYFSQRLIEAYLISLVLLANLMIKL